MAVFQVNEENSLIITDSGEARLVVDTGGEKGLIQWDGVESVAFENKAQYKELTGISLARMTNRAKCFKPAQLYVGGINMSKVTFNVFPPLEKHQAATNIPLFRKNDGSDKHYAAGYYALVLENHSAIKQNPMEKTVLGARKYEGPFNTENQAKRALARLRKSC